MLKWDGFGGGVLRGCAGLLFKNETESRADFLSSNTPPPSNPPPQVPLTPFHVSFLLINLTLMMAVVNIVWAKLLPKLSPSYETAMGSCYLMQPFFFRLAG